MNPGEATCALESERASAFITRTHLSHNFFRSLAKVMFSALSHRQRREAERHSVALRCTAERVHHVSHEAYPIQGGAGVEEVLGGGVTVSNLMEKSSKEEMMVQKKGRWWWLEQQTPRPRLQDERVAPQTAGPENPPVYCGAADGARRCLVQLVPASELCRSGVSPPQITVTRKRFASVLRANKENSPRRSECAAVGGCLGRIMNNRSCFCFNFKENFHSFVRRAAFGFDVAFINEALRALRSSSRPDYFLLDLRNWDGASTSCVVPCKKPKSPQTKMTLKLVVLPLLSPPPEWHPVMQRQ